MIGAIVGITLILLMIVLITFVIAFLIIGLNIYIDNLISDPDDDYTLLSTYKDGVKYIKDVLTPHTNVRKNFFKKLW